MITIYLRFINKGCAWIYTSFSGDKLSIVQFYLNERGSLCYDLNEI